MKTDIIPAMKLLMALAFLPLAAFAVTVPPLPPGDSADTEVSTNIPFRVDFATMSRIEFSVSLLASPSNAVEVAIGRDANDDGALSLDEADYAFGYDCERV